MLTAAFGCRGTRVADPCTPTDSPPPSSPALGAPQLLPLIHFVVLHPHDQNLLCIIHANCRNQLTKTSRFHEVHAHHVTARRVLASPIEVQVVDLCAVPLSPRV